MKIQIRKNQKLVNILARILTPNSPAMPYVLGSKRIAQINAETICEQVIETLEKFGIVNDDVLMPATDGAEYMIEAAISLKKKYPNLLHITCLIHSLYCMAEKIRNYYPDVKKLIVNTKAVFKKSPQRIKYFLHSCSGIPEPPQHVLTRWGTWLEAAFYYYRHFQAIKSVVSQFDPKDSIAIKNSQEQFNDPQIEVDLLTIQENYTILTDAIKELQDNSASLSKSFQIVHKVITALQNLKDVPTVEDILIQY